MTHYNMVFISEQKVKQMEDYVMQLRTNAQVWGRSTSNRVSTHEAEDRYEEELSVPNSILDSCQNSFLATDEKCEKAST